MKKLSALLVCLLLVLTLCGCNNTETVLENLTDAGYTVEAMSENKISSLNSDMKYTYNGKGTITQGYHAVNEKGGTVFVLEFTDREDMTVAYRELKAQLQNGEIIDVKGKTVVYGIEHGVKAAIN